MQAHGAPVARVINGGGIPRKNAQLNQIYANVLNKPVLVPEGDLTGLGAAIFAFVAAGTFPSVEAAQLKLCPAFQTFEPQAASLPVYEELFDCFRRLYLALGSKDPFSIDLTGILGKLRQLAVVERQQG